MSGDFLRQHFDGMLAAGEGYKGVGSGLSETSGIHQAFLNGKGANWLSPEFHVLQGNALNMTNNAEEQAQHTIARGNAVDNCADLGMTCSNTVSGLVQF